MNENLMNAGRRRSTTRDSGLYPLVNAATELERLDAQSRIIWHTLGGRHVHSPISDDASLLLDIGCGSGAVSISLALKHPNTEVIGVDKQAVPSTHVAPPNLMFLHGDIFELVDTDPRLQSGGADLVYSRLLYFALHVDQWEEHVRILTDLAKPAGYVEIVELDLQVYSIPDLNDVIGSRQIYDLEWFETWREAGKKKGFDVDAGNHLQERMVKAGLEDIQVNAYPFTYGSWLERKAPDVPGFSAVDIGTDLATLVAAHLEGLYEEEDIKKYQADAIRFAAGCPANCFWIFWVVRGRKPANAGTAQEKTNGI